MFYHLNEGVLLQAAESGDRVLGFDMQFVYNVGFQILNMILLIVFFIFMFQMFRFFAKNKKQAEIGAIFQHYSGVETAEEAREFCQVHIRK